MDKNQITQIAGQLNGMNVKETLQFLADLHSNKTVFSTSFSIEDQIIAHEILRNKIEVEIFTLDTGRLFPETYSVWARTNETYQTNIKAYYPEASALETYITNNGPQAFYTSVDLRKECCAIRKVQPLKRALQGKSVWVTGLRAEHSPNRQHTPSLEWDEGNQILKFHPLMNWDGEQIRTYVKEHNIIYNTLHDKGFVSIGCAPCTRAVKEGEDFRAGRWWWEDNSKKECGLHTH